MDLDFRRDPSLLSTIVDEMADGVFTVDASGRIVAWSQGAERITGYAGEEVVGQSCRLFEGAHCKGFAALTELLQGSCDATTGTCHQECKLLAKDGREVSIHGSVRLIHEANGQVAGAVCNFSDLTPFLQANERIALLEEQTRNRDAFGKLIGASTPMQEVFRRIRLAAHSDVTVFVSGESGTGKELAAGAIHSLSNRKDRPFLAINCSAIPETLLESELFGHVKGAFTSADRDKTGLFQAAEGGTLFLDEIGDVSPLLQLKLLRVLQEREIRRVGADAPTRVNVRLITATNKNLKELVASQAFREDFYYRIHVFEIRLPPLRERREDLPLLVRHFIDQLSREYHRPVRGIARDALQALMNYPWPGNVRELRNALEHAFVTVSGDTITLLDLPIEVRTEQPSERTPPPDSIPLSPADQAERRRILEALDQTRGNRTEAARLLGTSRVTLWKKIRKYAIDAASASG